jgi:hypothetical protein
MAAHAYSQWESSDNESALNGRSVPTLPSPFAKLYDVNSCMEFSPLGLVSGSYVTLYSIGQLGQLRLGKGLHETLPN